MALSIKKRALAVLIFSSLLSPSCLTSGTTDANQNESNQPANNMDADVVGNSIVYESESLQIVQISERSFAHVSFLNTIDFGKVACNGMILIDGKEALVFDTPANEASSEELLKHLTSMGFQVRAVVATHFHADCIAGLAQFHARGIPSYANNRTLTILEGQSSDLMPQYGFDDELELKVGDEDIYVSYFGEGHTKDNIVGYFPAEHILFGGCLIKEKGANKGNLEDANTVAWSSSVQNIKDRYPEVKLVIPGHGKPGGKDILDYTIEMFR